jgi:methylglutaconyl-CoA hydratase
VNYKTILVHDMPHFRTVTLNRPERRNAMTPEMQLELLHAFNQAAGSGCRALVIKGAGGAFCSGLDLSVLQTMQGKTATEYSKDAKETAQLFCALYELPIPTISAVHGPAIAGGTGLAMICDFTLATPDAKFGFTEARIGFVPALVSAFLTLHMGDKRSRDLLFTARIFDAEEAYRFGLVTEIVAKERLDLRIHELTDTLATNSLQSLAATKRLMIEERREWLDKAIKKAIDASVKSRETEDFREGVAAFLEKRKPLWNT